jgi:hypothetical protein
MSDDAGYAKRMNGSPKHVVSRSLEKLEWNNSHLIKGDIAKEVSKLNSSQARTFWSSAAATS